MDFPCVSCRNDFYSELVPARDLRTGGFLCPSCDGYRKAWPSRLVFPDPSVRMAEVDAREVWE